MRVKLIGLSAIALLSVVACEPQGRPTPEPNKPPQLSLPECRHEYESNGPQECVWHGSADGKGVDLVNRPDGTYSVILSV